MCFWFRRGTASESPKKTSVANAVSGPTPGCVIKRTAAGCRRACWLTCSSRSSIYFGKRILRQCAALRRCTPTGQVSTSLGGLGGESVFTLNQKRLEQLKANRLTRLGDLPGKVREAIHYEPPSGPLPVTSYGTITRPGYRIEKLIYESEPGIVIPSLLFLMQALAGKLPCLWSREMAKQLQ